MRCDQTDLGWVVKVTLSVARNIFAAAKEKFNTQSGFYNRTDVFHLDAETEITQCIEQKKVGAFMDYDGNRVVFVPKSLAATKRQAIHKALEFLRLRLVGGADESDEERRNYLNIVKKVEERYKSNNKSNNKSNK